MTAVKARALDPGAPAGPRPVERARSEAGWDFTLPEELAARRPQEEITGRRDDVRLLVTAPDGTVAEHPFRDVPDLFAPGDLLVVNRSATLPAAVDLDPAGAHGRTVHFSTQLPAGDWLVELRTNLTPDDGGAPGDRMTLPGDAHLRLRERHAGGRLWYATVELGPAATTVPEYLHRYGRPIRYDYLDGDWPLSAYQTIFADVPGSAEMPSAGRPFTAEVVARLVARGVLIAPITLHTGVASPEAHEEPYAEWFEVPGYTASLINDTLAAGSRVVAVGTTVVRAVESAVSADGRVVTSSGWTDLVVTPARGIHAVTGLLTGLHEPRASHLRMLRALVPADALEFTYRQALAHGLRWHEFGDVNLLLK